MLTIAASHVDYALLTGLNLLYTQGRKRASRNGDVLVHDMPVTTYYSDPLQRVSLWDARDANPFFHLHEALWMLGGRNDVASLSEFVQRMAIFSDDGYVLRGAYGHRWRNHWGFDQLLPIMERLAADPTDRRCVLGMWDPIHDLNIPTKDTPCNLTVHFQRNHEGKLDMTVFCRSNDIVWGAYGANAVHFSMLQEYMAAGIDCPVGGYWQVSNNYHAYCDVVEPLFEARSQKGLLKNLEPPHPMVSVDLATWQTDLEAYLQASPDSYAWTESYFPNVVVPMRECYFAHKAGSRDQALAWASMVVCPNWRQAAQRWLQRRYTKQAAVQEVRDA